MLAAALLAVLAPCGASRALAAQAAPAAEEAAYRDDYLAFAELLTRFRRGEDAVLGELRAAARDFAGRHGRHDAPEVVAYYAALDAGERAQGWREYEAFAALWSRVARADRERWGSERWSAERPVVLADLRSLAARARGRADFVPAGRALSLCARIEVRRLATAELSETERAELLARARAEAGEALAIFERAGQRTPRLEPLLSLARLARLSGRVDEAEWLFERVALEARAVRSDDFREHALLDLVVLARWRGDPRRIEELLDRLAGFRTPEQCWALAFEHAWQLVWHDQPEVALAFLERCPPRDPAEQAQWRWLTGLAELRAGDPLGARAALAGIDPENDDEDALLAECTLELRDGGAQAVLETLAAFDARPGTSDHGRMYSRSLAGEALLQLARPAEAIEALEQAIELADGWQARLEELGLFEDATASMIGERLGLHTVVLAVEALAALGRPLEAAALVERVHSRTLRPSELDAQDLRAWAAAYEHGLLTFVCGADRGFALHVGPQGATEVHAFPWGRRAVRDAARRLREAALGGDVAWIAALGDEVARDLLPPGLRDRLARGAPDARLLVLPHGPLEELPLELLALDGALLDERAVTLVLPGLPDRRPGPAPDPRALGGWRLFGDPPDDRDRPALPAARRELERVLALHPGAELYAGASFQRQVLVEALSAGAPVHVATHLVPGSQRGSGRLAEAFLQLGAGEVLSAHEILDLAPRSPLVVLSACETAGGRFLDAEGLQGVARAFLEPGTRNLLVTLWPVEDAAASAGAVAFHEALARGELPSRAARSARGSLRAEGAPAADWAALRLLGRD